MNLGEIKEQVMQIIAYAKVLEKQYNNNAIILEGIYNIINKEDSLVVRKLAEIIEKYKGKAQISNSYIENANKIIMYIDSSNSNVDELVASLSKLTKKLNEDASETKIDSLF